MMDAVQQLRGKLEGCGAYLNPFDPSSEIQAHDFVINRQTVALAMTSHDMEFESNVPGEYWHQAAIEDGNLDDGFLEAFINDPMTTTRQAEWAREMMTLPMIARKSVDAMAYVPPDDLKTVLATMVDAS